MDQKFPWCESRVERLAGSLVLYMDGT